MNAKIVAVAAASFAAGAVTAVAASGIAAIVIYRDLRKMLDEKPRTYKRTQRTDLKVVKEDNQK